MADVTIRVSLVLFPPLQIGLPTTMSTALSTIPRKRTRMVLLTTPTILSGTTKIMVGTMLFRGPPRRRAAHLEVNLCVTLCNGLPLFLLSDGHCKIAIKEMI